MSADRERLRKDFEEAKRILDAEKSKKKYGKIKVIGWIIIVVSVITLLVVNL